MLAYELFATADIMPGLGLVSEQQEHLAEVHFCLGQEKGIAQGFSDTMPMAEGGKSFRITLLIIKAVAQRQVIVEHLILRHRREQRAGFREIAVGLLEVLQLSVDLPQAGIDGKIVRFGIEGVGHEKGAAVEFGGTGDTPRPKLRVGHIDADTDELTTVAATADGGIGAGIVGTGRIILAPDSVHDAAMVPQLAFEGGGIGIATTPRQDGAMAAGD